MPKPKTDFQRHVDAVTLDGPVREEIEARRGERQWSLASDARWKAESDQRRADRALLKRLGLGNERKAAPWLEAFGMELIRNNRAAITAFIRHKVPPAYAGPLLPLVLRRKESWRQILAAYKKGVPFDYAFRLFED